MNISRRDLFKQFAGKKTLHAITSSILPDFLDPLLGIEPEIEQSPEQAGLELKSKQLKPVPQHPFAQDPSNNEAGGIPAEKDDSEREAPQADACPPAEDTNGPIGR